MPVDRLIPTSEVCRMLGGISRQTLWRWSRTGFLPPSRQVGPEGGRVAWRESEIQAFIESREIAVGSDNVGAGN